MASVSLLKPIFVALGVLAAGGVDAASWATEVARTFPSRPSTFYKPSGGVSSVPKISGAFYVARDGWPPADGFAPGSARWAKLPAGTVFGRRGDVDGRFATRDLNPARGTLGLYPKGDREPMRYYRNTIPLRVMDGTAAPAWSSRGGANQVRFDSKVSDMQRQGMLTRTVRPNFALATSQKTRR